MGPRRAARLSAAACALMLAGSLAACGSDEPAQPQAPGDERLMDKTWHAIGIYTSPDAPSTIPEEATDAPTIVFGRNAAVGSTGCARFRADLSFSADNQKAYPEDADTLAINAIEYDERAEGCEGEVAWAHSRLTQLLTADHEFGITIDSNNQLVLTLRDGRVDSPAIRYASF